MVENESMDLSQKYQKHIGKVGLLMIATGLIILYYDAYRLIQHFPTGYRYYDHPEIHIVVIGVIIAFTGTSIFIYNFSKGRNII